MTVEGRGDRPYLRGFRQVSDFVSGALRGLDLGLGLGLDLGLGLELGLGLGLLDRLRGQRLGIHGRRLQRLKLGRQVGQQRRQGRLLLLLQLSLLVC